MNSYLLTWNENKWKFEYDNLTADSFIKNIKQGNYKYAWSTGVNKSIRKGDRVYLMRVGSYPKGIFATGYIEKGPYGGPPWDPEKASNGKKSLFIDIIWDNVSDSMNRLLIPEEVLITPPFVNDNWKKANWYPQSSGVYIPPEIANEIESLVATNLQLPEEIEENQVLNEGAIKRITVNSYERNPNARKICLQNYGFKCAVCEIEFEKKYGEIGRRYIHVHHLVPLSKVGKEYTLNPITDLRPICPNCQAMVHKKNPPFTIDELKQIINKTPLINLL